jgi:hypothetical protein
LYTEDYLQHVNEKHTHYTIEMRHENGVFAHQADLITKVYHHPVRDLAVMHIALEDSVTEMYIQNDYETELDVVKEKSHYYPLTVGQVRNALTVLWMSHQSVISCARWFVDESFGHSVGQAEPKSLLLVGPKQTPAANCCAFIQQCSP